MIPNTSICLSHTSYDFRPLQPSNFLFLSQPYHSLPLTNAVSHTSSLHPPNLIGTNIFFPPATVSPPIPHSLAPTNHSNLHSVEPEDRPVLSLHRLYLVWYTVYGIAAACVSAFVSLLEVPYGVQGCITMEIPISGCNPVPHARPGPNSLESGKRPHFSSVQ